MRMNAEITMCRGSNMIIFYGRRPVDDLGRVNIPKEVRKQLQIQEGESLEVLVDEEAGRVIFQKTINKEI